MSCCPPPTAATCACAVSSALIPLKPGSWIASAWSSRSVCEIRSRGPLTADM